MAMVTIATAASRPSWKLAVSTKQAISSSITVGPRLKTTLRIRKSVDREPRSMTRDSPPVCLDWWKSRDRDREWAKASTADRARAAWETGVKMESRI